MSPHEEALRKIVRNRVRLGEPLARHTTLRIGGPADFFVEVADRGELVSLLKLAAAEALPVYILGNGSNLLVSDEGVRGLVLTLGGEFNSCQIAGTRVVAGGGYNLPKLSQQAAKAGLTGLEFACSIPGTVGAGLLINAGAHGGELVQVVREATVVWPDGRLERLEADRLGLRYRGSDLEGTGCLVVEVVLELQSGDPAATAAAMKHNLEKRRLSQPLNYPNAGSIFKNPPGGFAGRYIEGAGCKGWQEGAAQVSEKHANFIINLGGATARDVLTLMTRVRDRVLEHSGVRLEPEVKIWGPSTYFIP